MAEENFPADGRDDLLTVATSPAQELVSSSGREVQMDAGETRMLPEEGSALEKIAREDIELASVIAQLGAAFDAIKDNTQDFVREDAIPGQVQATAQFAERDMTVAEGRSM